MVNREHFSVCIDDSQTSLYGVLLGGLHVYEGKSFYLSFCFNVHGHIVNKEGIHRIGM